MLSDKVITTLLRLAAELEDKRATADLSVVASPSVSTRQRRRQESEQLAQQAAEFRMLANYAKADKTPPPRLPKRLA